MLHARASKVWDTVTTTSEKYEGQSVYDPPSCIFSNVHAAYPVVIQSTLSWNEKLEGSASKFKGNSRGEDNKSRAERDVCHKTSAFSSILGGGGNRGTGSPLPWWGSCCPPLHPCSPHTHPMGWSPAVGSHQPSQCSVDGMTGQFNSLKLQKTNLAQKPNKQKNVYFFARLVDWPSLPCDQMSISDAKEEKIKQLGVEARGGRNRVGGRGTDTSCFYWKQALSLV